MLKFKRVLFVCTGNSCRSVMAEAFLKKLVRDSNIIDKDKIVISSAGTGCIAGFGPTENTIKILQENNIDVSNHLSQPLTEELIKKSDIIFVMDNKHKEAVLAIAPYAGEKVYLLEEYDMDYTFAEKVNLGIQDPIGRTEDYYRKCFDIIKTNINRIAKKILKEEIK